MQKLRSLSKIQLLAILIIGVGIMLMAVRVSGMLSFFREVGYAQRNNFLAGNPSPDLLRPWMSLRYVAQAYAVPQKYLYDAAGIEPRPETSMVAIHRLNQHMRLGVENGQPKLLAIVRQAIRDYNANPVATGLLEQHVEGWMTVQYIANSTGVPAERYLEALDIPASGNHRYLTLDLLADELGYAGGPRKLSQDLQAAVERLAPDSLEPLKPDEPAPKPIPAGFQPHPRRLSLEGCL